MRKIVLLILLSVSGCSFFSSGGGPQGWRPDSVEIFFSRNSLDGTEFEHYKIVKDLLYYECGSVEGSDFSPAVQTFLTLSAEQTEQLEHAFEEFTSQHSDSTEFEEAGKNKHAADPGVFHLQLESNEKILDLQTSFDAVAQKETSATQLLYQLASKIRSYTGEAPCNNKSFYGLS